MEWLDRDLWGSPLSAWFFAGGIALAIVIVVPSLRLVIRRRWGGRPLHAASLRTLFVRLGGGWRFRTTLIVALAVGAIIVAPPPGPEIARWAIVIMIGYQLAILASVLVDWGIQRLVRRPGTEEPNEEVERATRSTLTGLRWLLLLGCYAVIVLLSLQNLGVNITAMVAGLGIGGIAVALAVQNILGDLFGSLTIALDRPFVAGDFIVVGSEMGTVEHVGLKTTRVRSLSGEQLIFPNSDLLSSRVRNFKRMNERRVTLSFGVVYATEPETLERIPGIVRECIESVKGVRFDRCHFMRYGDSSLDFETVYYALTPDFNAHMDLQQKILFAISRRFRDRSIEFAFPSRTVYLARESEPSEVPARSSSASRPAKQPQHASGR